MSQNTHSSMAGAPSHRAMSSPFSGRQHRLVDHPAGQQPVSNEDAQRLYQYRLEAVQRCENCAYLQLRPVNSLAKATDMKDGRCVKLNIAIANVATSGCPAWVTGLPLRRTQAGSFK